MTERHEGRAQDDAPLDLSPLAATADPAAFEELVARIMEASAPELERRRQRALRPAPGLLSLVAGWTRPILAAAAVVALISTGVLQRAPGGAGGSTGEGDWTTLPEALGLPSTVATWLDEGRTPTSRELVLAMEDGVLWP